MEFNGFSAPVQTLKNGILPITMQTSSTLMHRDLIYRVILNIIIIGVHHSFFISIYVMI